MKNSKVYCFKPIIDYNCEILILGSMPSKISRENDFYYSNKSNRFWKILSFIYNVDFVNIDNNQKKELLLKFHIALFDVYSSCEMKKEGSSLDSDIKNQRFNDIPGLVQGSKISRIFITSKKAYTEFIKRFGDYFRDKSIEIIYLPSPSSANRSVFKSDDDLNYEWKKLME